MEVRVLCSLDVLIYVLRKAERAALKVVFIAKWSLYQGGLQPRFDCNMAGISVQPYVHATNGIHIQTVCPIVLFQCIG